MFGQIYSKVKRSFKKLTIVVRGKLLTGGSAWVGAWESYEIGGGGGEGGQRILTDTFYNILIYNYELIWLEEVMVGIKGKKKEIGWSELEEPSRQGEDFFPRQIWGPEEGQLLKSLSRLL